MGQTREKKWLLLIHQIPPKPDYFRVKIWRRLRQVGAVALKQSVYVLPPSDQALEDLSWILKEIVEGGGDAFLCESSFLDGPSDEYVVTMFQQARAADYNAIIEDVQSLAEALSEQSDKTGGMTSKARVKYSRLKKKFEAVLAIDFFNAAERSTAAGGFSKVAALIIGAGEKPTKGSSSCKDLKGKTWVTRAGIYVDRIACGWLIKRYIDSAPRFKFVSKSKYTPKKGELRFDMFDGEYTHVGNRCTFEAMVESFGLNDLALGPIGEIVHDIDFKDEKFSRPETTGIASLFSGIAMSREKDEDRMTRGAEILDQLYEYFSRQEDLKTQKGR